jgi:hypothetical protein
MIAREMQQGWNKPDDDTVGAGNSREPTNGTRVDISLFYFYFALLGTVCFIIFLWHFYLTKYRDTGSVDAEIPEPQATSQGEKVVEKKSAGERRKELLAGFEEHKVQRVSKLKIGKKSLHMNATPHATSMFSESDRGGLQAQRHG